MSNITPEIIAKAREIAPNYLPLKGSMVGTPINGIPCVCGVGLLVRAAGATDKNVLNHLDFALDWLGIYGMNSSWARFDTMMYEAGAHEGKGPAEIGHKIFLRWLDERGAAMIAHVDSEQDKNEAAKNKFNAVMNGHVPELTGEIG